MDEININKGVDDDNSIEFVDLMRYLDDNANEKEWMELLAESTSSNSQSRGTVNLEINTQSWEKNELFSNNNYIGCSTQTNEEVEETFETMALMPPNAIFDLEYCNDNNNNICDIYSNNSGNCLKISKEPELCQQIQTHKIVDLEAECLTDTKDSEDECTKNIDGKLKQIDIKPHTICCAKFSKNNWKYRNSVKALIKNKNNKSIAKQRRNSKHTVDDVVVNKNRKVKYSQNNKGRGRLSKNLLKQNLDIITDHENNYIIEAHKNPVGRPPDTCHPKEKKAKKLGINRKAAKKYRDKKRMDELRDKLWSMMKQKREEIISVKFKNSAKNLFRAFYRVRHIFEKFKQPFPEQELIELTDGY